MVLLSIVSIVCSILTIILFFKVWGLCDDVNKLTNYICCGGLRPSVQTGISTGDNMVPDNARNQMLNELRTIATNARGLLDEDYARIYGKTTAAHIKEVKDKYVSLYKGMEKPFPADVEKVETVDDLWELFGND